MNEIIVSCGCGNTDKFADTAYKLLFPGQSTPTISHLPRLDDERANEVLQALKKDKKKYAYLFRYDDNSFEAWDLIKGEQAPC